MNITSTAIGADDRILKQYCCDGENISPPLTFSLVPKEAKSLLFILDDPDAPGGTFTHWIIYDMSPATLQVPENRPPNSGKFGSSSFGKIGYGGPCPPSGKHRYFFKLFALDKILDLAEGADIEKINSEINGHVIDKAEIIGLYQKQT